MSVGKQEIAAEGKRRRQWRLGQHACDGGNVVVVHGRRSRGGDGTREARGECVK